ncbi:MAG: insulinase family protein [Muribaculaceae bacterium]|nr:insulinase family protein [Muribaculaceae bacterium]
MNDPYSISIKELANGLRIAVAPDKGTAMVAVNVLYDTGARDESRELTGIAHLFEHLMFGASAHVPSFEDELEHAGGRCNAWTSNDFTNFYDILPAQNIATAFHLESDRMCYLNVTEQALEVQRGVVTEEFKQQCLDRPYGDLFHHLRRLCYSGAHPYSWPVIGLEPAHIANATLADAQQWYHRHYGPQNAILTVCGNVEPEQVFALAEEWFGSLPAGPKTERHLPAPGFPEEDVYEEVHGPVPSTFLVMAIPMDVHGTKGYYAADVVSDILSAGRSARYNDSFIHGRARGLILAADASIIGSEHEGLFTIMARLAEDSPESIREARELLLDEARRLVEPGNITDREWQRSFNNFEATFRFSNNNYARRATNIALSIYHGTPLDNAVTRHRKLTIDDIRAEAERLFFKAPIVTLAYRPDGSGE